MVEIRRVVPGDWADVKAIRLDMLLDTPSAYITTFEQAAAFPDEVWIERCEDGATGDVQATYLGFDGDDVVAMGVGFRRPQQQNRGTSDMLVIVSVFVAPTHRGSGVADRLMAAIEDWGRSWGARLVALGVTETNDRAKAFYERIGYQPTGERTPMGEGSSLFEVALEKTLSGD